jgi:hypothetical protein
MQQVEQMLAQSDELGVVVVHEIDRNTRVIQHVFPFWRG